MGFLLDTNILSELVRRPRGRIADHIAKVGEQHVCTSIIVAAELRYSAAKKASARLTAQLEAVLGGVAVLALEPPLDAIYGTSGASRSLERRQRLAHCRSRVGIGTHDSYR